MACSHVIQILIDCTIEVILADEVGLEKTIEAGLVLPQRYVDRQRKLIVVVPASLR